MNKNTLRKLQLTQLDMLIFFDKFCKQHNLSYFLIAGTLLGCVRHNGFIPWDDDIDVAMPRKDYENFISTFNNTIHDLYFLQNYVSNNKVPFSFTKLRKKGTAHIDMQYPKTLMHQGIFIDIFPIDNAPDNKFIQRTLYIANWIEGGLSIQTPPNNILLKYLYNFLLLFADSLFYRKIFLNYSKAFNNNNCNYLNGYYMHQNTMPFFKKSACFKKSDIYPLAFGEFEGYSLPIPKNYDYILKCVYGEYNIYPPESERYNSAHGSLIYFDTDFNNIDY